MASKLTFDTDWTYAPAPEGTANVKLEKRYGLFINGRFAEPKSGKYFRTISPSTEKKLADVADAGPDDVDRAVKAARRAHDKVWSKMKPSERGKYIFRIARIVQER